MTCRRKQKDNCERTRETVRRLFLSVGRNVDKDPSIPRGPEDWNVLTTIYKDYPFNGASRSVGCAAPHRSAPLRTVPLFRTRHCALWAVTWIISVPKLRLNTLSIRTYALLRVLSSNCKIKTNRYKINTEKKNILKKKISLILINNLFAYNHKRIFLEDIVFIWRMLFLNKANNLLIISITSIFCNMFSDYWNIILIFY